MTVSGGSQVVYKPGSVVSFAVSAAVADGDLVESTGNMTVGPAGASSRKVIGRAMQAADTAADIIAVQIFGYIARLKANGTVTAGDELIPAAAGDVSTFAASGAAYVQAEANNARAIIGVALEGAATTVVFRALVGKS